MRNYVQKVWQVAAWLLAIAIVVLSLVPPSHRPITDASHNVEHFAIFWATGFAFGVGYPVRPFVLAIALTISCGAIEIARPNGLNLERLITLKKRNSSLRGTPAVSCSPSAWH